MTDVQTETQYKKCPNCGQDILAEAIKCRHCKTHLTEHKSEDGMSSSQASFFYSSIVIICGGIFFISKSLNLAFILTAVYSFVLYLVLDRKNKR
ncbi:MAG: hypothetical protein ACM3SY_13200 [Candidatus Omnitrophota bacterium]